MNQRTQILTKLDPDNDLHWTKGGEPRLDVLREIVSAPISRESLSQLLPGLNRDNVDSIRLKLLQQTKEQEAEARQRETQTPTGQVTTRVEELVREVTAAQSEDESEAERHVKELRDERATIRAAQRELSARLQVVEKKLGEAEAKLHEKSRMSSAEAVRRFSAVSRDANPARQISYALQRAVGGARPRTQQVRPLKS